MTPRTRFTGMAKPMPSTPRFLASTAVLMPMSSPLVLISAPPELPTLMGASVWMKFSKVATTKLTAAGGADDALGHGLRQAHGIADGQHHVADTHLVGVAQRHHRDVLLEIQLQHGQVGVRVAPDDFRVRDAPVGELGADQLALSITWWLVITCAALVDDDARAQALFEPIADARPDIAKQLFDGVGPDRHSHHARRIDVDHGRRGALHGFGVRVHGARLGSGPRAARSPAAQ